MPQTFSKMSFVAAVFVVLCLAIDSIHGHGRMMDPINRSSVWRKDDSAPHDYVDDMNNCGGKPNQWNNFGGKCGVCGDSYGDPHPQANENTGTYGKGKVVKTYSSGQTIDVSIELTTNHMGYFLFSLCTLGNANGPESGEGCFQALKLADGSDRYTLPNKSEQGFTQVNVKVKLPSTRCDRCVLRWHYTVGNSWGVCDDGVGRAGCGPQETFRSCSDIAIH